MEEVKQRRGRSGDPGGANLSNLRRNRRMKGRKRKEQEMAINACKIHIICWARGTILFSLCLRVKIPSNHMTSYTSATSLPCSDPPECGFRPDPRPLSSITTRLTASMWRLPGSGHGIYTRVRRNRGGKDRRRVLHLFTYLF